MNGNGVDMTERQKAKWLAMNATRAEVNEIAHAHAVQAVNHLGNQIPGLLKKMIEEAVTASLNGYHQSLVDRGVIPPASSHQDISLAQESRQSTDVVNVPHVSIATVLPIRGEIDENAEVHHFPVDKP